ncbi:hypothetical protein BH09BAC3_BH09BAC3_23780 [soil metagenome]
MKFATFILSIFLFTAILHPAVIEERVEQETEDASGSMIGSQHREIQPKLITKPTFTRQIPKNVSFIFDSKRSIYLITPLYLRHRILLI